MSKAPMSAWASPPSRLSSVRSLGNALERSLTLLATSRVRQIGGEFEYALSIAVDDALVPREQALGLARTLDALRWSNRRLTRLVRDREAEERAYATDTPPNLCAQIAAWRESAYAALPESSSRFLAEMGASEPRDLCWAA